MWRFEREPEQRVADLGGFLAALRREAGFFDPRRPVLVARAPGRLDLMGGIADYSGSLVLELPLAVAAYAAVQAADGPEVVVRTIPPAGFAGAAELSLRLAQLAPPERPLGWEPARELFAGDPARQWAAYVAGVIPVLHAEYGARFPPGLRLLVYSEVPPGKGVSSSAAIEVAAGGALAGLCGLDLGGRELALLCQQVENLVVGAPCGVMDQMTAACGRQDQLLALLCQPAELQEPVPLPPGVTVWGLDSGIRHAVSGADYTSVRCGAFMGYRILADLAGLPCRPVGDGRVQIDDRRWGGYLANVTPAEWEGEFAARVPETLGGGEFLARYQGTPDRVTRVDPQRRYPVRQPTAHPIYEHDRVQRFRELLAGGAAGEAERMALGGLMHGSHASYSACGLGSDGTDLLVELAGRLGPPRGLYGAKITGGGSGGTVAVLADRRAFSAVREVAEEYRRATGRACGILGGSSPGALEFGLRRLVAD